MVRRRTIEDWRRVSVARGGRRVVVVVGVGERKGRAIKMSGGNVENSIVRGRWHCECVEGIVTRS